MPEPTAPPSSAPKIIHDLVAKFADHQETYQRGDYNETQLRRDFLDPFFKALGWDIDNEQGYAEAYREVIHEDALRVEKTVKAPDYGFRIGGTRKFFVEAKKPSVDIRAQVGPAFQLRRYAWTAKLPLSILTDFEELAVYDCRVKPDKTDNAAKARIKIIRFDEYVDRWDEIAGIFSREAILKGSFDKFAESAKKKRGTAEVDEAFLEEIESWRESLAKNISLRNEVTDRELNFAVQLIIDRIIFLRMCEGRGIEPYDRLNSIANGQGVYGRLVELFHRADEKYNSGLFHFSKEKGRAEEPDRFTTELTIDDKILRDIIRRLYYPESPYEFAALPADILGQVYEQFLGKVIVRSGRTRVRVEDKPEVKKAGGVYYTPTYIVDYIVENTVGKLLEGKTPQEVGGLTATWKPAKNGRPLSVLDPACGSGSFLIVAYQYLLDWYLRQYIEVDKPEQHARGKAPRIYQNAKGDWRLTGAERKRILLSHIYGVDIDYQAVEVTKLSLLLKVLEGETEESLQRQARLFHKERALPDLANNIKCGNSLIASDFYDADQLELFEDSHRLRINAFDWQEEFPHVVRAKDGGFDAIVGNPPYISIQTMTEWTPNETAYLKTRYDSAAGGNYDIYVVFLERGFRLLRMSGRLGYITPNKYFVTDYGRGIRSVIGRRNALAAILDFKHGIVFDGVSTYTCLTFLCQQDASHFEHASIMPPEMLVTDPPKFRRIKSFNAEGDPWAFSTREEASLIEKLQAGTVPLLSLPCSMSRGSSTGNDDIFILQYEDGKLATRDGKAVNIEAELLRIPLYATDFGRYRFKPARKERVIFPYLVSNDAYSLMSEKDLKSRFPKGFAYLASRRDELEQRKQFNMWYSFSAPRNLDDHDAAQLMVPLLANTGLFCRLPDNNKSDYCPMASGGFTIRLESGEIEPAYVLGLLNSRLLFWRLQGISNVFRGGWITCTKQYVGTLPIKVVPPTDKRRQAILTAVNGIIAAREQVGSARTPQERDSSMRRLLALDRQIDQLVYELYGLTDKEIAIVEDATRTD